MPLNLTLLPSSIPPLPPTAAILSTTFLGLGALHFLAPLQMCKIFGLPCSSIERPSPGPKPTGKPEAEETAEPAVPTTATVEPPPEGVEGKEQCRDCRCRCRCQYAAPEREPEPAPLAFIYANGGREIMLAIAFLGMGVMGDRGREGMRALMLGIAVRSISLSLSLFPPWIDLSIC